MFWTWGYGVLKLANVDKKSFKRVQVTSSWWSFCNRKGIHRKQSMYCKNIKKDSTSFHWEGYISVPGSIICLNLRYSR